MNKLYDGDTFEYKGRTFRVNYTYDEYADPPWDSECGHGPVRKSRNSHGSSGDKRPGERPLNNPNRNEYQFYYDWQAACKLAREDGWNTEPFDAPNRIQRAVQADFDFLRLWLSNDWNYVGVIVTLIDEEEDVDSTSLWCVETYKDHHMTLAYELAEELLINEERSMFPVSTMGV